jgi:hypothetical protein
MKLRAFLREEQAKKDGDIKAKIKKFFKENPNPSDDAVHDFAEDMGIDPHKFEEHIYAILTQYVKEDKIKGGKADNKTPEDIAKKHGVSVDKIKQQLKMGIEVEMEHVNDRKLSAEIALDHLDEIPDYYNRLKKMEKDAGIEEEDQKCPPGQKW